MINEKEFRARIEELPEKIYSKTMKASYTDFLVVDDALSFVRVNTNARWVLDIAELFKVYKENSFINTAVIKAATNKKVNSPSVAVLMAIKCIDKNGNRIK